MGVLIVFVWVYEWTTWFIKLLTGRLMQVLRVISRLFICPAGGDPGVNALAIPLYFVQDGCVIVIVMSSLMLLINDC